MAVEMDFPFNPTIGQRYQNSFGIVYEWNGVAWVVGFFDTRSGGGFDLVGDVVDQIRTLLQDTDIAGGVYRYSTDSIVQNMNMGLWEMYRLRPDIFLETDFVVPVFNIATLDVAWPIEKQWIPPIVYYAAGLTQLRDEEGTQDNRATAFMTRFTTIMETVNA